MNEVDLNPPVERSFLGMRPQDFVATLGGLLGSLPVGRPGSQFRPFQALFPLAQGLERKDQDTRLRYTVDQLRQQYGGEDSPEFKAGLALVNAGDVRGGIATILKGVTERNALGREDRRREFETSGENLANTALTPVSEPGITGFERIPEGVGALLSPLDATAVRDFQSVDRPRTVAEIIADIAKEKNPEIRGAASKAIRPYLTARALEESKLRPRTDVEGGKFIRKDPLRGTAAFAGHVPESPLEQDRRTRMGAQTRLYEAQEARAQRPAPPQPGSPERPQIWQQTMEGADGKPTVYEMRSYSKPNPEAPGGIEQVTVKRPMGTKAWRPHAPRSGGAGDRVTETQTTVQGTTAEKPVWSPEAIQGMNAQMPEIMQSIAPGLKIPTDPAERQAVVGLLQKDVQAAYRKQGFDVTLRWVPTTGWTGKETGGKFQIISARRVAQPYSRTSRTVKGPQGKLPPPPPDTPDDDDGDDDE